MKPAPFAYRRPVSLDDAVRDLAGTPGAKVLAGGQSLVPLLSMRLAAPPMLVDINAVSDLAFVRCDESGVRIGALARHADVLADPDVRRVQPLVPLALGHVAHATIRNRGTTVGSLVHADAAAEMPMVLTLLGGSIDVVGPDGRRTIAADDLYVGPLESSVRPDEIAVEAFFPALADGAGVAFEEIARRHGDYALCGVAALVTVDPDLAVTGARVGLISVGPGPVVVDLGPAIVAAGGSVDPARSAELLDAAIDPEGDIHGTAAYRRHLAHVLTDRAVRRAHDDARTRRTGSAAAGAA